MIDSLIQEMVKHLNIFPVKHNGIFSEYNPNVLLGESSIDYNKHLQHSFGEYAQVGLLMQ